MIIIASVAFVSINVNELGAIRIDYHAGIIPLKIIIALPMIVTDIVVTRVIVRAIIIDAKGGIAIVGNP